MDRGIYLIYRVNHPFPASCASRLEVGEADGLCSRISPAKYDPSRIGTMAEFLGSTGSSPALFCEALLCLPGCSLAPLIDFAPSALCASLFCAAVFFLTTFDPALRGSPINPGSSTPSAYKLSNANGKQRKRDLPDNEHMVYYSPTPSLGSCKSAKTCSGTCSTLLSLTFWMVTCVRR